MPRSTSPDPAAPDAPHVLLYDGVCGFCDVLVRFLLRRDRRRRFAFAAIQSDVARAMLERHAVFVRPDKLDTVYVLRAYGTEDEHVLHRARAVAFVLAELGGVWIGLAVILRWIPRPIADWGYDRFARVRYRLFGRRDRCALPSAEERARFFEVR